MCDASDYAIWAILGRGKHKTFLAINYISKTLLNAQLNYVTIEKELLAIVFIFDKFKAYLIRSKVIVYTNHLAIKNLIEKKDVKPR